MLKSSCGCTCVWLKLGSIISIGSSTVLSEDGLVCVNLAMVRGGRHLGDRALFPSNAAGSDPAEVLTAFIYQHYANHPAPERLYLNVAVTDEELAPTLSETAGHGVRLSTARQAMHKAWVEMAEQNASLAIRARRTLLTRQEGRIEALRVALALDAADDAEEEGEMRVECFDISHLQGESTVASCVVFHGSGMRKSDYRRFNIKGVEPGDDYAAIRQAVLRRYEKIAVGDGVAPSLILIDGGKGQLAVAVDALEELGLVHLPIVGVAKGEARKPGLETLVFADGREPVQLPMDHPALHLIQEIRDEAHRFAVSGHRAQRSKTRRTSRLDEIVGIGPQRRKALIAHFGGLR